MHLIDSVNVLQRLITTRWQLHKCQSWRVNWCWHLEFSWWSAGLRLLRVSRVWQRESWRNGMCAIGDRIGWLKAVGL